MKDKDLPQSVGEYTSEPIYFPRKEDLCRRLDQFYQSSNVTFDVAPSEMFRGALFSMRQEYRDKNPDWMAQVAHSLREILYQFEGEWKSALIRYGSTYDRSKREEEVGRYYGFVSAIAHHDYAEAGTNSIVGGDRNNPVTITPKVFEGAVLKFGDVLFTALRRQVDAHREIDEILKESLQKVQPDQVKQLINLNPDAYQYFYAQADERWLEWLWENGFFDAIKRKAEDPTRYSYKTPILHYLVKVAEEKPGKVTEIINSVSISEDNFNPEVIDQFLRICSNLPVEQLKQVTTKIRDENWVELMGRFNRWGHRYKGMLDKLAQANKNESILEIAEVLLTVRPKQEISKSGYANDNPFYIDDLSYTQVFEHLVSMEEKYAEEAFKLAVNVTKEIISLGDEPKEYSRFEKQDRYPLYEVDFFDLRLDNEESARDNVKQLFAVLTVLAKKVIENKCNQPEEILSLYREHIGPLPDSKVSWRFKLFILSLCEQVFKNELKDKLFKLFETNNYYEITSGTEYKKALQISFGVLSEEDKRLYVKRTISYFRKIADEADDEDMCLEYGSFILSMIVPHLTDDEKQKINEKGFELHPNYEPETVMGPTRGGRVTPRGPISQEEFDQLTVEEIANKLRTEWAPKQLQEEYRGDDFLNPRNADGVAAQLKNSIAKRLQDFVDNAELFFGRDSLDPHYTYSFLCGFQEAIKDGKQRLNEINWEGLIKLLAQISESGVEEAFDTNDYGRETLGTWLADWTAVHSEMASVLQELLREIDGKPLIDFPKYRDEILEIIGYLLSHPDPRPEDEEPETATQTIKSPGAKEAKVSDPFTMAINSVRGSAFQAFVLFVYQDGKRFAKKEEVKIDNDVKNLYEQVLNKENTRALMFMFGYYLPSFYFRDKKWIQGFLPKFFPEEKGQSYFYLAAWEGYLANNLYEEIFFDEEFQKLYKRGLSVGDSKESHRDYFKDPDKGIATHLALAFMHYKQFGFKHRLFKMFWKDGDVEQHAAFVSFIGRTFISGDKKVDKLLETRSWPKKRMRKLWDDLLEDYGDPKLFVEFGYWINLEKPIFEPKWLAEKVKQVLVKTKGVLSSEYGLTKSIAKLAEKNPQDTLEIARRYFLDGLINQKQGYFYQDQEWLEAFRVLYDKRKEETEKLINELIGEGGRAFWKFKTILRNNED